MAAAPLVRRRLLKAIFLECSFVTSHPDELLFGHLTPKYVIEELQVLANFVAGGEGDDDPFYNDDVDVDVDVVVVNELLKANAKAETNAKTKANEKARAKKPLAGVVVGR
jgi:hypothetical protein